MDIQNRLLRIVYSPEKNVLLASDVRGRVHKFDLDLNLIQSSPVVSYDRPMNSICMSDKYIFTKDRFGSIGKWDIETLVPLDFYDGKMICDRAGLYENEEPSPTPNRGIAYFKGRVYTNNGYCQMVILDAETFELIDIRESPSKTFIDCICAEHPTIHALTDVEGTIYIGNLETNEFPIQRKIDTNVVHGVRYDKIHDRFWTTQDGGLGDDKCVRTGVTTIEKDGTGFKEYKISHEDVEFIALDPTHQTVFAGGFNGKISVFDNSAKEFNLLRTIGPLEFQIISAAVVNANQIYALLQTGDVIRLDGEGKEICRARNNNRCVWTLEPHPQDDSLLYAATDQGVSMLKYGPSRFGSVQIEQIEKHDHSFGIVKDVRPFADGSYVGISRTGFVFKSSKQGKVLWSKKLLGVPRSVTVNLNFDRCLVASDIGTVWELQTSDGSEIDQIPVGSPSYACVYADDGRRIVTADQGQQVHVYSADSHQILGSIAFSARLKRLVRASNGGIFVAGPNGMFELDLENYTRKKSFGDYMVSTKENGVLCDGHLYVGGYGYQVATYNYEDGQIVDLQETLPDFTKAFAARIPEDGVPILLVGGRGGFINAYKIYNGAPYKVREFYIR